MLTGIFNQICYDDTKHFGPLYRLWMLNQPKIVIASAKHAEKILQGMQHHPKSDNYRFLHAWMGHGLLTSQGNLRFFNGER
jgi:Cytochrome P450